MSKKPKQQIIDPSNEVHKLIIHREYLDWNKRFEKFSGKYRINPYHMTTVCPKPNQVDPTALGNERYIPTIYRDPTEEAFSSEYLKRTISRGIMTPGQKYRGPQTSSQEIGWYNHPVVNRQKSESNWHNKAKNSCFETNFAEEFLKSVGTSPFKVKTRSIVKK